MTNKLFIVSRSIISIQILFYSTMIYFHITESFNSKITEGQRDALNEFINKNSNRNSLRGIGKISSFTKGIYVLRIKSPFCEIIFQEQTLEIKNDKIKVYFVRGVKGGLQDYVSIRDGKWLHNNDLSSIDLQNFIKEFSQDKTEQDKISVPEDMVRWQREYELKVTYDIFESESWMKYAFNSSSLKGMQLQDVKLFALGIEKILENSQDINIEKSVHNYDECFIRYDDIVIRFLRININSKYKYLLINGANTKTQTQHSLEAVSEQILEDDSSILTYQDVCRIAVKAYPNWVIKDKELWLKIEKNNEFGNLSLLPEQTEFLSTFKFPKYINGQAGSGKSTMLYYLFSNVYYYKIIGEIPGEIIFLTENDKLLAHTKKAVYDLLLNNPEFDLSSDPESIIDLDKCFYSFKNYLLSLLPEDCERFSLNKYLNFSKFKILYTDSNISTNIKAKYSPELVWFAISTYINGYNLDSRILTSNYENLPREGKSLISKDDLHVIESQIVFPFYDKLITEDGYWDKLELIKYISNNINIKNKYDVIFCDEAQDFSKIELEFILKQSSYTNYNLNNLDQFPIIFAGDALQTVNPTGFRSEVLTSMIYNELSDPKIGFNLNSSNLEFTPTFNYRSSQTIVNLANTIQYHRKSELGADVKKPQISKRPVIFENEHLNVFVDIEKFKNDDTLKKKIEFKTIIVPVNNDEIEDFKRDYPVLKKFNNIISSIDSKGIDFSEVVVFGFGTYYNKYVISKKDYAKKYFFNKLYVAVTRAQNELVIIDNINTVKEFWESLINNYINSNWKGEIEFKLDDIIIFNTDEIIESSKSVVEQDAERQLSYGLTNNNIPVLKIASSHFIKLGLKEKYFSCLAEIEKIQENWKKAANYFKQSKDDFSKVINSLWLGKLWDDIIYEYENKPDESYKIKFVIAKLFVQSNLNQKDLNFIYDNIKQLRILIRNLNWRNEILKKMALLLNELDSNTSVILSDILEEIIDQKDSELINIIAKIYFDEKKFHSAKNLLEQYGIDNLLSLKVELEIARKKEDFNKQITYLGLVSEEEEDSIIEASKEIIDIFKYNRENIELYSKISLFYIYQSFIITNHKIDDTFNYIVEVNLNSDKIMNDRLIQLYVKLLTNNLYSSILYNHIIESYIYCLYVKHSDIETINKEYKILSSKLKTDYIPLSEKELKAIINKPFTLLKDLPDKIKTLEISNFRRFKNLKIKDIGLINLVVGDNNIGKTSLLEAFLFTPDKEKYIKRLSFAYIERSKIYPFKKEKSNNIEMYYSINSNFLKEYPNKKNDKTSFKFVDNRYKWDYNICFNHSSLNKSDLYFKENHLNTLDYIQYDENLNQPYIPYGKGYSIDLSKTYESLVRPFKNTEEIFLERLKIFIPGVEQIFVNTKGDIEIRENDSDFDRTLSQYGEGANKLFRILLLLTIHKGKRLLIDEIDAGIHFSRFKNFWKILIEIAIKDNTQIIATTHNDECIQFFIEVLNEEYSENTSILDDCKVMQMKVIANDVKINTLGYDSFNLAYNDRIELRGGKRHE